MLNTKELRQEVTKAVDLEFNESAGVLAALDLSQNAAYKAGYFRQLAITSLCRLKIEQHTNERLKNLLTETNK